MIRVSGGFSPDENYNTGTVVWDFINSEEIEVTIDTTINKSSRMPVVTSKTVNYTFNSNAIVVGNSDYEYEINSDSMYIHEDVSADGIMIEFVKIK